MLICSNVMNLWANSKTLAAPKKYHKCEFNYKQYN